MNETVKRGYIGLFWIDNDNETLFGIKRIPIRLGFTGPDGRHKDDKTVIESYHKDHWNELLNNCEIPEHVKSQYFQNKRFGIPLPSPNGRVSYIDKQNKFLVDVSSEKHKFSLKIQDEIKSRFLLPNDANVEFELSEGISPQKRETKPLREITKGGSSKLRGCGKGSGSSKLGTLPNRTYGNIQHHLHWGNPEIAKILNERGKEFSLSVLQSYPDFPNGVDLTGYDCYPDTASIFLAYCQNESKGYSFKSSTWDKYIDGFVHQEFKQAINEVWEDHLSNKLTISF